MKVLCAKLYFFLLSNGYHIDLHLDHVLLEFYVVLFMPIIYLNVHLKTCLHKNVYIGTRIVHDQINNMTIKAFQIQFLCFLFSPLYSFLCFSTSLSFSVSSCIVRYLLWLNVSLRGSFVHFRRYRQAILFLETSVGLVAW